MANRIWLERQLNKINHIMELLRTFFGLTTLILTILVFLRIYGVL